MWYWQVRFSRQDGRYGVCQIATAKNLDDIQVIISFYEALTCGRALIEGMSEDAWKDYNSPLEVFTLLFDSRR
jgi:hypothetical protein